MSFATQLKAVRETRGLTQAELAKMSGIAISAIAHFEADDRQPCIENVRKVARALKVSADILLEINGCEQEWEDINSRDEKLLFGLYKLMQDVAE